MQLYLWRDDLSISTPTEMIAATISEELKTEFSNLHSSTSPPVLVHPHREKKAALLHFIGEITSHEDSLLTNLYDSAFYLVQNFLESDEGRETSLKCK